MAEPSTNIAEALKVVKDLKELVDESDPKTRATPLQVLGRSYLLILVLLSVAAFGSGYIDHLFAYRSPSWGKLQCVYSATTLAFRISVLVAAWFGLAAFRKAFNELRSGENGWLRMNAHPADLHRETLNYILRMPVETKEPSFVNPPANPSGLAPSVVPPASTGAESEIEAIGDGDASPLSSGADLATDELEPETNNGGETAPESEAATNQVPAQGTEGRGE